MKTENKASIEIWVAFVFILILFGFILGIMTYSFLQDYYNGKENLIFDCRDSFNSAFYNCPTSMKFQNLTGYYCDGNLICENKIKEELKE